MQDAPPFGPNSAIGNENRCSVLLFRQYNPDLSNPSTRTTQSTQTEPVEGIDVRVPLSRSRGHVLDILPERASSSLQLRVFGFGLLVDGDVGVGVFPDSKEVVI
jgi:hypothetical protein